MLSKYVAPVNLKKWLSDSLLIFFSKFIISLATTQRFLMAKRELLSISPCLSKYAATVTQKKPLSDGFFFKQTNFVWRPCFDVRAPNGNFEKRCTWSVIIKKSSVDPRLSIQPRDYKQYIISRSNSFSERAAWSSCPCRRPSSLFFFLVVKNDSEINFLNGTSSDH